MRLAALCFLAPGLNSCVPQKTGAAAGYYARDEGIGLVRPRRPGEGVYVDPPTHEEMEFYENGGYGYGW